MYKAFDTFLQIETWYTRHPTDERRFFEALYEVVRNPKFNADDMGAYMRKKLSIDTNDDDNQFSRAIDRYTADAWAVTEYLKVCRARE